DLAQLSRQAILGREAAPPQTLLFIAQALKEHGNPKEIVRLLEKQISLQPPNIDLYRVLAEACDTVGNSNRARELRSLAQNIKN
ncbi:MAG TPA: hypothetical protein VF786_02635, partial [Terriglobales bacterium]